MSITQRGPRTHLLRVYVGRDPLTKKRIEINETVCGPISYARKRHAQLKVQKDSGSLVKNKRMTVNQLLDLYFEVNRHTLSEVTLNGYKGLMDSYVRRHIGDNLIKPIGVSDFQKFFNSWLDKVSTCTVTHVRKVLRAAFKLAASDKYIAENPVAKTKLPPAGKSSASSLTCEEANALIAVRDRSHYGYAFTFQLRTGLRPQELMALVWDDIDFDEGTVRVERACKWVRGTFKGFGITKTSKSMRLIEITPGDVKLLKLHREKQERLIAGCEEMGSKFGEPKIDEWIKNERAGQAHLYNSTNMIFPNRWGRVPHYRRPLLEFKKILREAEIARLTLRWYDLRHTHATLLLTAGEPPHEVADRMGHSTKILLSTYAHVLPRRRRSSAKTIQRLVPIEGEDEGEREPES